MRINFTCILLFLAFMQVAVAAKAQKVSISKKDASLMEVFREIRKQTGHDFVLPKDLLKQAKYVSIHLIDTELNEVLKICLEDQPFTYEVNNKVIVISEKEKSLIDKLIARFQEIDVRARVADSLGNPLSGATVTIKGTNRVTTTNHNGEFFFKNVNENATLLISYLGYENKEIPVKKELGEIQLKSLAGELDEVNVTVNTGYQSLPKERSTGSFSTVDKELFNQQVGTDILSRLPHIANSMVMDNGSASTPKMMIRGLSTIRGPKDPLIVLDNFPYDGDINNINPNIVENITILKDASASSIWGARAANGVIVITTKSGRFNRPITLSFNSNFTFGVKPDLSYIRQMASNDYIDMEQELFRRNFYNSQINSTSRPVISPVVDLLVKARPGGTLTTEQAQLQIDALRNIDARDDFNRYMYKPSVKQQYFLSAQGGTEKFSWTSSVGYDHNKETLGNTYQRINLRFQNTYRPVKQFSLTTGLYYTQAQNKSGRLGYNNVSMKGNAFVPYMQMADGDGNVVAVAKDWNQNYIQTVGNGKLLDWRYYPLTDWKHRTTNSNLSDVLATAVLDYQILSGLNASLNYQYEKEFGLNNVLADENSFMTRDYINRFAQITNGNTVFIVPKGSIYDKSTNTLNANNLRGQLNFDKTSGRHNMIAIAGAEIRVLKSNGHQERFYGYNPNNLTTGAVDYTTSYPNLPRGNSFIQRGQYLNETATRFASQFANVAYTFDTRYVISASVRRDASNLFGLKTNDQWNPFWSAGFAWKVSSEKFYKVDFLPHLNFRTTYGFSGNIDPAMVAVNTIAYSSNNSSFNGEPMAWFNNYYNPLLKWETSKMFNFAMDFRLKNNRLSGVVEYYHKKGENLFGVAPLDYTTGVDPHMIRNVASMKGNGWDIELKSLNIDHTLKWQTILNFSIYKDKVIDYLIERTLASGYISASSPPISGLRGMPVYAIYGYKWAGLDPQTGEAQGYLNGEISKDYTEITGTGTKVDDLEYFGSAIPTKFGSLINALSYKNINMQIGVSFKLDYWFRRNSINYTNLFNSFRGDSDYALRWQQPGDETHTNVPVNLYTTNTNRDVFYNGSSVLVEKGDHIRLQYLSLGYDFKFPANGAGGIKGLQLFFNAGNLGLLWKASNTDVDPDFNLGAFNLKTPANYSLGLKAKL